jgi:DNA mismatch repair ATPase MutS
MPTVRGTTLWSLVNRTRTRVGSEALRERLLNPPHTANEILALQLSAGESFYLAEVRRIGALALALADHGSAVAVVDEPFRGTNVHDAAEATLAVITRLAAHPAALVLVASHVGEVVPTILADPRVALFYFAADVTGDQPRFDYRLREGVSEQRLGMTLLRQEGVLDRPGTRGVEGRSGT